jgi:hypothetical protein
LDCEADGPDRGALWHGVDPEAEVARTLGWWTNVIGIDHPVEDYERVTTAIADGRATWNPGTQRYDLGTSQR